MKLWEAILLGSQIRGKADGLIYDSAEKTSCALGASIEALIGTEKFTSLHFSWPNIGSQWPWINKTVAICPVCKLKNYVMNMIPHLNNTNGHDWTRERIALEFVKPLEEPLKPAPVEVEMKEEAWKR